MKAPEKKKTEPAPEGSHVARLYGILHIGTYNKPYQGEDRMVNAIRFTFELCNELKVFKEGEDAKPWSISQEFTFSMDKKANLKKIVDGMLGKAMSEEEAAELDIETLLGKACLLSIVHKEMPTGNTIALIQSASPLPKGLSAPEIFNTTKFVSIETLSMKEIEEMPQFLKEKIMSTLEFKSRFLNAESDNFSLKGGFPEVDINPDDIPF